MILVHQKLWDWEEPTSRPLVDHYYSHWKYSRCHIHLWCHYYDDDPFPWWGISWIWWSLSQQWRWRWWWCSRQIRHKMGNKFLLLACTFFSAMSRLHFSVKPVPSCVSLTLQQSKKCVLNTVQCSAIQWWLELVAEKWFGLDQRLEAGRPLKVCPFVESGGVVHEVCHLGGAQCRPKIGCFQFGKSQPIATTTSTAQLHVTAMPQLQPCLPHSYMSRLRAVGLRYYPR